MPIIGQYQISDIARVSHILHERWGRIVRLGGLLGRPDLLFVYDADEIEKVNFNKTRSIRVSFFSWIQINFFFWYNNENKCINYITFTYSTTK